jgi:sialic acid synthase SpsE
MLSSRSLIRLRASLAISVALATLALIGCVTSLPEPPDYLINLQSVEDLRSRFNADAGSPRLILLLSPT